MNKPMYSRRRWCAAAATVGAGGLGRMGFSGLSGLAGLAGLAGLGGCASEPRQAPQRVLVPPDGPREGEATDLAERADARILLTLQAGVGELYSRRWREGLRTHPAFVPPPATPGGRTLPIWDLSNPDGQGAVCVLTPAEGDRRHAVRLLHPGRPPRVVLEGPGEPLWDRPLAGLALSPDGTRLALVVQHDPTVRHRPLNLGRLKLLDLQAPPLADGSAPELPLEGDPAAWQAALGQRPVWLEGGTRLAYAAAGPRGRESTAAPPSGEPAAPRMAPLPALQPDPEIRLRAQAGDTRLTDGHSPVADAQGSALLLARGPAFQLEWMPDVSAPQKLRPVRRLQGLGQPVALIRGRYLIYTGAAHVQAAREFTTNNSPLVGPKAMQAIKVMDLADGRVQTLLEGVDPRRRVSAAARA